VAVRVAIAGAGRGIGRSVAQLLAGEGLDFCRGTDRDNPIARNCYRFGLRLRLVHRVNRRVNDDEVWSERGCICLGDGHKQGEANRDNGDGQFHPKHVFEFLTPGRSVVTKERIV